MGLYNLLHGTNADADVLLGAVGLQKSDVGRYRDVWVTPENEIAVYTRNGGGNRECWHADDPKWGNDDCHGEPYEVEVDETVEVTEEEANAKGYRLLNVYIGTKRMAATGRRIMQTRYTCGQPNSAECGCAGCVISYRLPTHPLYLRDDDDEFDSTYATIYFKPPDSIPEEYARGVSGDERWARTLEALKRADR